jgi:hypothetical protein
MLLFTVVSLVLWGLLGRFRPARIDRFQARPRPRHAHRTAPGERLRADRGLRPRRRHKPQPRRQKPLRERPLRRKPLAGLLVGVGVLAGVVSTVASVASNVLSALPAIGLPPGCCLAGRPGPLARGPRPAAPGPQPATIASEAIASG